MLFVMSMWLLRNLSQCIASLSFRQQSRQSARCVEDARLSGNASSATSKQPSKRSFQLLCTLRKRTALAETTDCEGRTLSAAQIRA